jgi:hypothetical protein
MMLTRLDWDTREDQFTDALPEPKNFPHCIAKDAEPCTACEIRFRRLEADGWDSINENTKLSPRWRPDLLQGSNATLAVQVKNVVYHMNDCGFRPTLLCLFLNRCLDPVVLLCNSANDEQHVGTVAQVGLPGQTGV